MPNPIVRRRRPTSAPFDELTTPNLILALLADRMPVVADGTAIASFTDFSASANHAAQAVGVQQPLYKVGIMNGLPALLWDGVNDIMVTGTMSMTTFTIFSVVKMTGAGMIYEQSVSAGANSGTWLYGSNAQTIKTNRVPTGVSSYDLSANWVADNAAKVITHHYSGTHAGHTLTINGVAQSLTAIDTADPGSAAASDNLYVGARFAGAVPSAGHIGALMVCSPALDAAAIAKAQTGLMRRWGVA